MSTKNLLGCCVVAYDKLAFMLCFLAMALSPQKFREIVLQLLFSADFEVSSDGEMLPFMMSEFAVSKKGIREAQALKELVVAKFEEIDRHLQSLTTDYQLERIPRLEHAILRLGTYELLFSDLPPKVAIAEALRMARKYATDEAVAFVNAILDRVYKECTLKAISS